MKNSKVENTKIEIQRLTNSGRQFVKLQEYKDILKGFDLSLDLDAKNYLYKYYNTSNDTHFLHATTCAIDKTGFSYCNVNGSFYKEMKERPEIAKRFSDFRNNYFTTLPSGHILEI